MRAILTVFILLFLASAARAETFTLPAGGRLELFTVGDWKVEHADQGDLMIRLTPTSSRTNAGCEMTVSSAAADEFSTKDKLSRKVAEMAKQAAEAQGVGKPTVKPFSCKQGFGFFFTLVDPNLVGKEPVPGDYKQITIGLIRLSAEVMVAVQILSDGDRTEGYQQLLGTVEGMELRR